MLFTPTPSTESTQHLPLSLEFDFVYLPGACCFLAFSSFWLPGSFLFWRYTIVMVLFKDALHVPLQLLAGACFFQVTLTALCFLQFRRGNLPVYDTFPNVGRSLLALSGGLPGPFPQRGIVCFPLGVLWRPQTPFLPRPLPWLFFFCSNFRQVCVLGDLGRAEFFFSSFFLFRC